MKKIFIYFFSFLYSNFSTYFENLFFKSVKINSELLKIGFYRDKLESKIDYKNFVEKKISNNIFSEKLIIKNDSIEQLIRNIFVENNIKKRLYEITGFNYSIDFLLGYSTYNIDEVSKKNDIYANHWHRDKPFSKNTLKIIIPVNEISNNEGPMEIMSIQDSSKIKFSLDLKNTNFLNKSKLVGTEKDIFFFLPNLCYHRAGIPLANHKRTQIMLQLNPSKKWKYSENLYKKQYLLEPKFPLLNLSDDYKLI